MVVIAAGRSGVTPRPDADPIPVVDRQAQFAGREPAKLGDVEQVALLVGQQPVEQGPGLPSKFSDRVRRDQRRSIDELAGGVAEPEQ